MADKKGLKSTGELFPRGVGLEATGACLVFVRDSGQYTPAIVGHELGHIFNLSFYSRDDEMHDPGPFPSGTEGWITPELRERPLSVHAADIIRAIIGASSEFNSATKTWALSLPRATNQRDAVRSEMRRWWLENRDAVGAGRYQQVGPPRK